MQDTTTLKIPSSAAIQMQTQLSNLIAIQNLQEYLKYLILTTAVEPQSTQTPQKLLAPLDKASLQNQETAMKVEAEEVDSNSIMESKVSLTPAKDLSFSTVASVNAANAKSRSQKLFSLMQKKFETKSAKSNGTDEKSEPADEKPSVMPLFRKATKKPMHCGHPWREHYAKGFCGSCYLRYGRTKKPWNCNHDKLYALGLCQKCYTVKYNMKKKTLDVESLNEIKSKILLPIEESKQVMSAGNEMEVESKNLQLQASGKPESLPFGVKIESA